MMLCVLYKKYIVSILLYDDEIVKNFITEKNQKVVLFKKIECFI